MKVVSFLDELNEVQKRAVQNVNGPTLVIAGAGSGKTRVLTYRIAYLLEQHTRPENILALTFTNKAAKEMKERIGLLVDKKRAGKIWMGTFHSMFSRILRYESDKLGYSSNFTVYDTQDSKNLIKSVIKDLKLDEKIYKPGEVLGRISKAKNNLVTANAYSANTSIIESDKRAQKPEVYQIYKTYAVRCKKADAMDFDDLLINTNILFRDFPDVLYKYQQKFKYILVDEYQDTNFSQYLIVKKLAEKHKNVCVVGDDAQSIYSFRGARIENILNFKNDYPDYNLFKLEQNYRSTKIIVDAANSLIAKNQGQIPKKVWSDKENGQAIKVIKTETDAEEGFYVCNSIMDIHLSQQINFSEMAILYRTNAQSRIFEEALRKRNIPYKVYGSISFYQRKEIKDLLAYFRVVINPNDEEAFKRIINYPARGIGKTTIGKIDDYAHAHDLGIWNVASKIEEHNPGLNKGTVQKIQKFTHMIHGFSEKLSSSNAYDLALYIANASGILNEFKSSGIPENVSKYENIQELLNGINEFTQNAKEENAPDSLDKYIENVALLTDFDNEKEEDQNKVSIMTVHSAKGLEFDYVHIAGLEENLFPSNMSSTTEKEIEEERRLFYVALTRARKEVILTYSARRFKYGVPNKCRPSRFIKEIDQSYLSLPHNFLVTESNSHNVYDHQVRFQHSFQKKHETGNNANSRFSNVNKVNNNSNLNVVNKTSTPDNAFFQPGMKVYHERFGQGKVLQLEGQHPNQKATVFFQNAGQKHLLLKFAKLKILK